jgi:predicted RNase H-like HicB family nuclease
MQTTASYTVIISRHPRGFVASCPAFSDCITLARSRGSAYKSIKDLIRKRVAQFLDDQTSPPVDPVVTVKHLRLNLRDIEKEINLR